MGKPRNSAAPSPRSIASLSTALIMVASVGMAFYFGELRGPGLRSFVTGPHIIETGVLCGILVALVISAHLAIVNSVRQSRSASPYRALVRRASQCDVADAGAANEFEAAPEVADLVRRLVSQHERVNDLASNLDVLRSELQGLAAGMRRSKDDLRPLRGDAQDQTAAEITRIWNELLERVRTAPAAAEPVVAPAAAPVAAPVHEFGTVDLGGSSNDDDLVVQHGSAFTTVARQTMETQELTSRIDQLESTLQRLADELQRRDRDVVPPPAVAPAGPVVPAGGVDADLPRSPFGSMAEPDDALIWNVPESSVDRGVDLDVVGTTAESAPVHSPFLGGAHTPSVPVFDVPSPARAAVTPAVTRNPADVQHVAPVAPPQHHIPDVPPFFRPQAPVSAFTEEPEDVGPAHVEPEAASFEPPQFTQPRFEVPRFEVPRFDPPRFEPPAQASSPATPARSDKPRFAAPESAFAQQEPRFEDLKFPHFVGQPVRKPAELVEVTYGSNPENGLFVEEDDASTKDDVVDLRSLGAVEFKE